MSENTTNTNQETSIDIDYKKVTSTLDNFEHSCGIPSGINLKNMEAAQRLMDIDWAEYKLKNAIDISIDSCILTQYSLDLQRLINREKATILWAKERRKKLLCHLMPEIKAYSFEEREAVAMQKHPLALQLYYKQVEAELHLTRIESLYFTVKNLADKLTKLADVKVMYGRNDSSTND